jgi:hypothetical protein
MNRYIGACIACAALSACLAASSQVVNMAQPALTRTVKANSSSGQTDVNVSIVPATVMLAGERREQGWFTVVSDPRQKLYWWRFQTGTYIEGNSFPLDEFMRSCTAYVATQQLVVLCTTARHLLIATSAQTYATDAALPGLVRAEFNKRAARLDTGFDYFDKTLNLWTTLGPDFFAEPGRANSIERIALRSVTRAGDNWEVVVAGAGQAAAKLILSPDFTLRQSARIQ